VAGGGNLYRQVWHGMCSFACNFFFLTWGVRASLRASQLIPKSTEHPASPSQFKKYIISAAVYEIGCIAK